MFDTAGNDKRNTELYGARDSCPALEPICHTPNIIVRCHTEVLRTASNVMISDFFFSVHEL